MNMIKTDALNITIWRSNGDCPIFARLKYLLIMELTIATLYAWVFVMRHQMPCCWFLFFPVGSLVASWKTIEPPAALLLHTNCSSAVPVQFYNYNYRVTRVAGRLWVPTVHSRGILLQAKGDHLDRVHSDQTVLKMIRQGKLVQQSRSSGGVKSHTIRVKGTVRLLLQWDNSLGGQAGGQ